MGNLALLQKGPNDRIGNKPFSIKKPTFKKSSFTLTNEISKKADWSKDAIRDKQKKLAENAKQLVPWRF
jgi:hypothetical protein